MTFRQRQYFKLLTDAAIPLLGYFAWNWGIYFVFLFYILDLVTREVIFHLKAKMIIQFQQTPKKEYRIFTILACLALLIIILIMHLVAWALNSKIEFVQEIISFLSYSELGIKQGFVLVPLVALSGYMQLKTEFILPEMHKRITLAELVKKHFQGSAYLVLLGILILSISFFVKQYQWIILALIVVSPIIFLTFTNAKKHY